MLKEPDKTLGDIPRLFKWKTSSVVLLFSQPKCIFSGMVESTNCV